MRYIDIIESSKNLKANIINNIDINSFEPFMHFLKNNDKNLYSFFQNVEKEFIDIYESKDPLIFDISDDRFIFVTGVSGGGKSTYARDNFSSSEYELIETDKLFNDSIEVSEFQQILRKRIYEAFPDEHYEGSRNLWINIRHFNEVLQIIMDNRHLTDKTIVLDSGQIRHLNNLNLLRGKVIIVRTSVNESIKRACKRFSDRYPNATEEEIFAHKTRKYTEYELYKKFNTLIIRLFVKYKL